MLSCRFVDKENVGSVNQLKSSIQRSMKNKIIDQFPQVEGIWDSIVPKKAGVKLVKWSVSPTYSDKLNHQSQSTVIVNLKLNRS